MPSKLGPHCIGAPGLADWIAAGPRVYKFDPTGLGASAQVPAGPLVIGKLDQQDDALSLTDWKAMMRQGVTPEAAADLRFFAQTNIYVGPNKPRVNRYEANPRIDVWEDDNEVVPDSQAEAEWYAQYCIEMMQLYEGIGKKRANFSFAVGTPAMGIWPYLLPAVGYARDHGHYIALHEYMGYEADYGVGWNQVDANRQPTTNVWHGRPDMSYPWGWAALRYRYIWDTVFRPAGLGDARLLITELGCDSVESVTPAGKPVGSWKAMGLAVTTYADMLLWYDRRIREDGYVAGAAIFTVGSVGIWAGWDIASTNVELLVQEWIAAERGEDAPIPPPEPKPMNNLLVNPSFEGGHYDLYNTAGERLPIQVPNGWEFRFDAYPDVTNPYDAAEHSRFGQPECNVLHKSKFPAAEWATFGLEGEYLFKWFGKAHRGRLLQTLKALPAGEYLFRLPVFADAVMRYENGAKVWADDPRACLARLKINEREVPVRGVGSAYTVTNGATAEQWHVLPAGQRSTVEATFYHPGGDCKVAFHLMMPFALPQNGVFIDGVSLTAATSSEPPPPPTGSKIADISKWQGTINPAKMRAAGIEAVIPRGSYGITRDQMVDTYVDQLRAEAMPIPAIYHYYEANKPWRAQLDTLLAVMRASGVGIGILDLEDMNFEASLLERLGGFWPSRDVEPEERRARNRQRMEEMGIDPDQEADVDPALELIAATTVQPQLVEDARQFMEAMTREMPPPPGLSHGIYSNWSYWTNIMGRPDWGSQYFLWIAAWTTAAAPAVPPPWAKWTLWQHTSSADGPTHGVQSARLDLNRFNGPVAELVAWGAGSAGAFEAALWAHSLQKRTEWGWNPAAALAKAILAGRTRPEQGMIPTGYEIRYEWGGKVYYYQIAHSGDRQTRRVYYAQYGKWGDVRWIDGPRPTAPIPPPTPPAPPAASVIDLRRFKLADPDCWRVVRLARPDGSTQDEDVQDMALGGGLFVRRKGNNGEWHRVDDAYFYLVHDTSPDKDSAGNDRVYTLSKNGSPGAPKSKVIQAVGELWTEPGTHTVKFRAKSDCRPLPENSGVATNSSRITRYEKNYTFNRYGQRLTFDEVVWEQTGAETQVYGRKDGRACGWIGWASPWGESEPVEIHWNRGRLTQEPKRWCSF